MKIAFLASSSPPAADAFNRLTQRYAHVEPDQADVIIALGGDGFMLQTQHHFMSKNKPVYGMNRGTIGFLLNPYDEDSLTERIARAERVAVHPLRMRALNKDGTTTESLAINEVSLLRQRHQAAKLRIVVDDRVRLEELICDGAMVATPVGSTAYNVSAWGPILPIGAQVLALTAVSAFRPRRWRGAVLPCNAKVKFEVIEHEKRPVSAVADAQEVRDVTSVEIVEDTSISIHFLFDAGRGLNERILTEQFAV